MTRMKRIVPARSGDDGTQAVSQVRKLFQIDYARDITCVLGHEISLEDSTQDPNFGSEIQRVFDLLPVEHQAFLLIVGTEVYEIDLLFKSLKE